MSILALTSSSLGEASVSNSLVAEAISGLRRTRPGVRVVQRDLGAKPIPHLTTESTTALRSGKAENEEQRAALALSQELLDELFAADTIVIGSPMYNFGITSTLKTWFDHVLRAGVTFKYSEKGPVGLVVGKRAIVIETRGGFYSEGPNAAMDSQEAHLRGLLRFIGIDDVTFVRVERLGFGPEARAAAIEAAERQIARLSAS